jgi:hypothetical protein
VADQGSVHAESLAETDESDVQGERPTTTQQQSPSSSAQK